LIPHAAGEKRCKIQFGMCGGAEVKFLVLFFLAKTNYCTQIAFILKCQFQCNKSDVVKYKRISNQTLWASMRGYMKNAVINAAKSINEKRRNLFNLQPVLGMQHVRRSINSYKLLLNRYIHKQKLKNHFISLQHHLPPVLQNALIILKKG